MAAVEIMSWNELSPVLSLTHDIPFGEKMENPEDEPTRGQFWFLEHDLGQYPTDISRLPAVVRH
jgi:hypothetical protein